MGAAQPFQARLQVVLFLHHAAEAEQGFEVVESQGVRRPVGVGGLLQAAGVLERDAQVLVRLDQVGFQPHGAAQAGDGAFEIAQFAGQVAQVHVGLGEIGPHGDGLLDRFPGRRRIAAQAQRVAQANL